MSLMQQRQEAVEGVGMGAGRIAKEPVSGAPWQPAFTHRQIGASALCGVIYSSK